MPETVDDLRAVLRTTAADATVPPPPFDRVEALLVERRRRRGWVAGFAAAALLAGVVTAVGVSQNETAKPAPAQTPTPTPSENPDVQQMLKKGPATDVAYTAGDKLILGRATVTVNGQPDGIVQGGTSVMVLDAEGLRVYRFTGNTSEVVADVQSPGMGAIDPSGRYAAWQKAGDGQAVVVVRNLDGSAPDREVTFPVTPRCCDNPFLLRGITTDGRLLTTYQALGKTWVWDFAHDRPIQEITGLGTGIIQQVAGTRVVVMDLAGEGALIGDITAGGQWKPDPKLANATMRPIFDEFSVWSPEGRRIATQGDRNANSDVSRGVELFDENDPGNFDGGFVQYSVNLPSGRVESTPHWEDRTHVVFLFRPDRSDRELIVRCEVTSYDCEQSASFTNTNVLLPQ